MIIIGIPPLLRAVLQACRTFSKLANPIAQRNSGLTGFFNDSWLLNRLLMLPAES